MRPTLVSLVRFAALMRSALIALPRSALMRSALVALIRAHLLARARFPLLGVRLAAARASALAARLACFLGSELMSGTLFVGRATALTGYLPLLLIVHLRKATIR